MERIACLYLEGNDSKVALFNYEGGILTLLRAESIDTSLAFAEQEGAAVGKVGGNSLQEPYNYTVLAEETSTLNRTLLPKLNDFFRGVDFTKCRFIPILTEPGIYFQKVSDKKDFALAHSKGNGKFTPIVDFVDLYDSAALAVYPSGKSSYLQLMDSLATMNGRRVLRIPSVKSAEISLASYIARKRKFSINDISLVLYVGKEYSKLIFLHGNKLFHIGSTLSIGKNSFDAHNVIARKILLELEQVSLGVIKNIIICGEDNSDELVSIISDSYPGSEVSVQHVETTEVKTTVSNRDSFIVPVAVAQEHIAELERKLTGINLLPQYLKEEQKAIQLDLRGYVMIALTFLSTAFFSMHISSRAALIRAKEQEISRIKIVLQENNEVLNTIKKYEARIRNVDQTKAVLSQLSVGTGILSAQIKKLSSFTSSDRNLWINQVSVDQSRQFKLGGYSFSRTSVIDLADSYNRSVLQHISYDPLRNSKTFKFAIEQVEGHQ